MSPETANELSVESGSRRADGRAGKRRLAVLGMAAALLVVAVFAVAPKAQDQGYHLFADTAPFGPVPNALNVLSNLGFFAAVWMIRRRSEPRPPDFGPRLNIRA